MKSRINPKEAENIVKALEAGVVPQKGVRHLLVGRNEEVKEVISILDKIAEGSCDLRFWVGDFGSGKSFMMRTIESIALQKNFAVSTVDLAPNRRLYASDGKAKALYNEIVNHIIVQSFQNGNVLDAILEQWINKIAIEISNKEEVTVEQILSKDYKKLVDDKIIEATNSFYSGVLSFEFGQAIVKYYEGMLEKDRLLRLKALRWIKGEIDTKTEAKRELDIGKIINDDNWYDGIKCLADLFAGLGYSGFVLNLDEAAYLYKIPISQSRNKNYEKVLNIYNECKSNGANHLFINFGVTRKAIFDNQRGFSSYGALKGRLGDESAMDSKLVNTNRTVLPLKPLSNEEIYTLLDHLINIHNIHYNNNITLSMKQIHFYMEEQLNRPGAAEFLTPRNVIKDFLEILEWIRQNPKNTIEEIISIKFGKNVPVEKDIDNTDDEIEVV